MLASTRKAMPARFLSATRYRPPCLTRPPVHAIQEGGCHFHRPNTRALSHAIPAPSFTTALQSAAQSVLKLARFVISLCRCSYEVTVSYHRVIEIAASNCDQDVAGGTRSIR